MSPRVLFGDNGEQPSLSCLSDAPWLNSRRPGSLYSIIDYEYLLLLGCRLMLMKYSEEEDLFVYHDTTEEAVNVCVCVCERERERERERSLWTQVACGPGMSRPHTDER